MLMCGHILPLCVFWFYIFTPDLCTVCVNNLIVKLMTVQPQNRRRSNVTVVVECDAESSVCAFVASQSGSRLH